MSDLREEEIERGTKALLIAVGLLVPLAITYRLCNGRMWLALPLAAVSWLALRSLLHATGQALLRREGRELEAAKARALAKKDRAS